MHFSSEVEITAQQTA